VPPPTCSCYPGFYTDSNFDECKQCRTVCKTCSNFFVCLVCAGNRLGPFEGQCFCPPYTLDKEFLGSPWCAGGTVAVPEIRFSNELDTIVIDFEWNVTLDGQPSLFIPTRELCISIINENSISTLGKTTPYCYIDKDH